VYLLYEAFKAATASLVEYAENTSEENYLFAVAAVLTERKNIYQFIFNYITIYLCCIKYEAFPFKAAVSRHLSCRSKSLHPNEYSMSTTSEQMKWRHLVKCTCVPRDTKHATWPIRQFTYFTFVRGERIKLHYWSFII
jgi:hypothetical protein